jgi:hypothetical protein
VTLLIRTILESEGNQDALIEPIVSAVSLSMRPEWTSRGLVWIETFDKIPLLSILETMRSRDLFSENTIGSYLAIAIRNKVAAIMEPAERPAPKPARVKPQPKPPRSVTRIPDVERNIALGIELLASRSTIKNNCAFGRHVRRKFEVEAKLAAQLMKVTRAYGDKPAVYTRLSWNALVTLSSATLPAGARAALEARIRAGEVITAAEIRAARGALKIAKPRRQAEPARRMAA